MSQSVSQHLHVCVCVFLPSSPMVRTIRSPGTYSGGTAGSEIMLQFHNSPAESRRGSVHSAPATQYKLHEALQSNRGQTAAGFHSSLHTSRTFDWWISYYVYYLHGDLVLNIVCYAPSGLEGNGSVKTSGLTSSISKEGKASDSHAKKRPQSKWLYHLIFITSTSTGHCV